MRRLKAIIFDFDGTIAFSEKEAHLPACNEAFRTLSIPIQWSWKEFISLLELPGNQARMEYAYRQLYPSVGEEELKKISYLWAETKKKLYIEKHVHKARLREGIKELIGQALEERIAIAIVSISIEEQIEAFLVRHLPELRPHIHPILGRRAGTKTASDSPLYRKCLEELGLGAEQVIAIEDSMNGLRCALKAGIKCVAVPNEYTACADFKGAVFVTADISRLDVSLLDSLLNPA
ncbi:phosphatase [Methylacidiphilum sp. Yel]|uniref:HAD family hydrolase n=1 Tax=Methylacidiphilum sp. Yel TaxID=1847730 RepID=UPI00106B664B|nr:HAD hydrolase-like protein [Methylacidiphilum sp. Yel]TFE66708.1 phosphatase [Methylacidiphilum sp. Yel]